MKSNSEELSVSDNTGLLPNFCHPKAVLLLLLFGQLLALVFSLTQKLEWISWWYDLAMRSFFIHWILLPSALCLCLWQRHFRPINTVTSGIFAWCLVMLITAIVSTLVAIFSLTLQVTSIQDAIFFVLRILIISAIISAVVLRYLYTVWLFKQNIQTGAQFRLRALQMRMRPHFLFNSLNTIAALINIRPARAERMIEDLAELTRSSPG